MNPTRPAFQEKLQGFAFSKLGQHLLLLFLKLRREHPEWVPELWEAALEHSQRLTELKAPKMDQDWLSLLLLLLLSERVSLVADAIQNYRRSRQQQVTDFSNPLAMLERLVGVEVHEDQHIFTTEQREQLITNLERDAAVRFPTTPLRVAMMGIHRESFMVGIEGAQDPTPEETPEEEMQERRNKFDLAKEQLEIMQKLVAVMRKGLKAGVGANIFCFDGDSQLEFPLHSNLENDLGIYGRELLRTAMAVPIDTKDRQPGGCSQLTREHLNSPTLFTQNTAFCGAYMKDRKTYEIYQILLLGEGFGVLELVAVFPNVEQIKGHLNKKTMDVQRYRVVDGELHMCTERKGLFSMSKVQPVQLESGRAEVKLTKALETRGIKGGCWNTIITGQLPDTNTNLEQGFRTASLGVAVAGMAAFFKDGKTKQAQWIDFDEVKLADGRKLSLGHCTVGDRVRVCTTCDVVVVAARKGSMLSNKIMWGA